MEYGYDGMENSRFELERYFGMGVVERT